MNNHKPDWNDAPHWAKWLAQDYTTRWYWYENRPYFDNGVWADKGCGRAQIARGPQQPSFDTTLESRP